MMIIFTNGDLFFVLKYRIKITKVGNIDTELNLDGFIEAESISQLKEIVIKLCSSFLEKEYDEHVLLKEIPEGSFEHETYGICVGSSEDWECQGFVEFIREEE